MIYRNSIIVTICFMAIAFAVVSTTLIIRGSTKIGINEDDFNVYFSDVKINGVQDLSVVVNERELVFSTTMKSKNEIYGLDYDITNGSKNYDAKLEMTCTGGNSYLTVKNFFDSFSNLSAGKTKSGNLTIKLNEQYTGDSLEIEIKCTITATGVERTKIGEGTPSEPVKPLTRWKYIDSDKSGDISKGDEIILASNENEKFNVIGQTDDTVTMLAKYNLDREFKQSQEKNICLFLNSGSNWEFTPGPKEIDIYAYNGMTNTYVVEYDKYLKEITKDNSLVTNLITLKELGDLGCEFPSDYSYVSVTPQGTCENSEYISWIANKQYWWTRSASTAYQECVWYVNESGELNAGNHTFNAYYGVRPTVTISKSILGIF